MTFVHSKKLIEELIVVGKWKDCLQRFMSVLRINLFLVDPLGRVIVSPLSDGGVFPYGGGFYPKCCAVQGRKGKISYGLSRRLVIIKSLRGAATCMPL